MSVRIPALLLAAGSLALWNNPWIALAIVAASIPIPWIAVIGANDRPPLPKGQPRAYTAGRLTSSTPTALPPGLTGGPNTREKATADDGPPGGGSSSSSHPGGPDPAADTTDHADGTDRTDLTDTTEESDPTP